MQDIYDTGITRRLFYILLFALVVENITKIRRTLPMEAIYILEPCRDVMLLYYILLTILVS